MREIITSAGNPRIKYFQSLLQKKYRDKEGKFIIEGQNLVTEAIESKVEIEEFIASPSFLERNPSFEEFIPAEIPVSIVVDQLFKKFTDTEHPQGIAALLKKTEPSLNDIFTGKESFVVIIDRVQDPGNLGTIIRTADAAGATGLIMVQGSVDTYNPKLIRSTMGSIFHLPIITIPSIEEACQTVREKGLKLVVSFLGESSVSHTKAQLKGPIALVVGNEAKGASLPAQKEADEQIIIEMPGQAESLNVAVATGIILFEIVRQRGVTEVQSNL